MRVKRVIFSFIILFLVILLIAFLLPGYFRAVNQIFLGISPTGILSIRGAAPQVLNIYLDNELCTGTPSARNIDRFVIDTTDCSTEPLELKAEIYDENGNCISLDGTSNVVAYICGPSATAPPIYCDVNTPPTYTITLDEVSEVSGDNLICNLTNSTPINGLTLDFYERWGNWSINVTVLDPDYNPPTNTLTNSSNATYLWNRRGEFIYPPGDTGPCSQGTSFNLGTLDLDTYNNGTGCDDSGVTPPMPDGCWLKNIGNIRLNITWNATNFTGPFPATTHNIDVRYGNFAIDDDFVHLDGAEVYMSDDYITQVEFPTWTGRVERCGGAGGVACDDDEDGNPFDGGSKARFNITWHINIPSGLVGGEYRNTVWAVQHYYEDGW